LSRSPRRWERWWPSPTRRAKPVAPLADFFRGSNFYHVRDDGSVASQFDVFVTDKKFDDSLETCLRSSGPDPAVTLQKFLAMHEHETVAAVTSCYVGLYPPRFCQDIHRARLAAVMEMYLRTRDRTKGRPDLELAGSRVSNDADVQSASRQDEGDGPDDQAIFANLQRLAKEGYVSLDDFGWFPRPEIRAALQDVAAQRAPCAVRAAEAP
jgi:hypothetical protein